MLCSIIRPYDAIVALSGTPSIYANGRNTVESLISSIQNRYEDDICYDRDYTAEVELAAFKPVRTAARVVEINTPLLDDAKLETNGRFVHTITAKSGIPYLRNEYLGNGGYKDGNYRYGRYSA